MNIRRTIRKTPSLAIALAAVAGLAPSVQSAPAAPQAAVSSAQSSKQASASAIGYRMLFRRETEDQRRGARFTNQGAMFRHFSLNQRQRRKYNRQRNAAGIKGAFN